MKNSRKSKLTCNQCHHEFEWGMKLGKFDTKLSVCDYPDCPNYGLVQMPAERMPKGEKVIAANQQGNAGGRGGVRVGGGGG